MLLTEEERLKFIQYLETSIDGTNQILKQMKLMKLPATLIEREFKIMQAEQIVVDKLKSFSLETIS